MQALRLCALFLFVALAVAGDAKAGNLKTKLQNLEVGPRPLQDFSQFLSHSGLLKTLNKNDQMQGPPTEPLEHFMPTVQKCRGIPAMTVSVVHKGKVLLEGAYGVKNVKTGEPVDLNTRFSIGSCSKAFTATALAILKDQGKFDWDAKASTYLPELVFQDKFAQEATMRDLLSHRTGVARLDMIWLSNPANMSSKSAVQGISYLTQEIPFRYGYLYNNWMYNAAGQVIERLSGMSYDSFLQQNIFKPLGMTSTLTSVEKASKSGNYAEPHVYSKGRYEAISATVNFGVDKVPGAGALSSTPRDMAQWMLMQLNAGLYNNQQVVSSGNLQTTHQPQTTNFNEGLFLPSQPVSVSLSDYDLGWQNGQYRGYRLVQHTGLVMGVNSMVSLVPDMDLGVFVSINADHNYEDNLNLIVTSYAIDYLLGLNQWINSTTLCPARTPGTKQDVKQDQAFINDDRLNPNPNANPNVHSVIDYLGQFQHPLGGLISVRVNADGFLIGSFNAIPLSFLLAADDILVGKGQGDYAVLWDGYLCQMNYVRNAQGVVTGFDFYLEAGNALAFVKV